MKRSMSGGAHRGPVAAGRQRRALRLMQSLLVVVAAALLMYAGYSLGMVRGFDDGRRADELGGPTPPSAAQTVVLFVLGMGALGGAVALQGGGFVRAPTPARLDELSGRAQAAAIKRAEESRGEGLPGPPTTS
jgi:hypothetical protein